MSQQLIDTKLIDPDDEYREKLDDSAKRRAYPRKRMEFVGGVRVDDLPTSDSERLAAEGNFYPLTMDQDGCLWVRFPSGLKVETAELEVLLRIESLLKEQVNLLRKIA